MAYPIIQDFIPRGRRNRPGHAMTPEFTTIHDTGNPRAGANAAAHARYLKGVAAQARGASWHFTVDDKEIYQHLPLTENGWHAGDGRNGPGNRKSIGIEICENSDGNRTRAEDIAAWLTAKLLNDFKLPIQAVKQHHDWSRKNCPRVIRGRTGGWAGFLAAVKNHMTTSTTPVLYEVGYIVKPGDTLGGIAAAHGVTLQQLLAANTSIANPNLIVPGQMIYVPGMAKQERPEGLWVVQVGSFRSRENAERLRVRLEAAGFDGVVRKEEAE